MTRQQEYATKRLAMARAAYAREPNRKAEGMNRRYEVQGLDPRPPAQCAQRVTRTVDELEQAITVAEGFEDDGLRARIREFELSGMPGIRPIRPDRYLSLAEARHEL